MQIKSNAIITGGAQGIGRAISDALLLIGWSVMVWDTDNEALQEEAQRHSGQPNWKYVCCDISDEHQVREAIAKFPKFFSGLHLLVNNAAIHANKPIGQLTVDEFRRVIDINLIGIFICSKYCETFLRNNRGVIVNIASTRAFQSEPNTEAYSASKGGVVSLTHALAISMGPEIRVNAISPGWIDVSALRKTAESQQLSLSETDHLQHPSGRVGHASDIASMVLFLADPLNSFITGQNFIVDGGMTRKMIYAE